MPPKQTKNERNLTPKKRRTKPTDRSWHQAFLKALEQAGNVRVACKAAKITAPTAYEHRERFPDFAAAWDEALEFAIDYLETVARNRALASSDTLVIFLLKAHRPEKYREQTKVTHDGSVTVEHAGNARDAWLADQVARTTTQPADGSSGDNLSAPDT